MFLGHFAVGFAAKKAAPRISLGTLFIACQFADLLWPLLVLGGKETVRIAPGITKVTPLDFTSYPYSHSLVSLALLAVLFGAGYRSLRQSRWSAVVVLILVVISHWVLDAVSHRPDMPLGFGTQKVGLGLWNSVVATIAVEGLLFAAGVLLYVRSTSPRDRIGTWSLVGLLAFLSVIYILNVFGPPPPSVSAVAYGALAMWLLVAWGYWIDRHREARAVAA